MNKHRIFWTITGMLWAAGIIAIAYSVVGYISNAATQLLLGVK